MSIDQDLPPARPRAQSEQDEAALWSAWRERQSTGARDQLFQLHMAFAKKIARRRFSARASDIDLQDLYQLAFAGLLEAIDRYDPVAGAPFKGFAARRITGSILDGIASMSELREQIAYRNRIRGERARSLAAEGSEHAEPMDALAELVVGLALGFMLEDAGFAAAKEKPEGHATGYQSLAWKETVQRLLAEVSRLPEREQAVVRSHYLDGMSFELIGEQLDLSKARISQIHRSALMLLKKRLPKSAQIFEG